MKTASDPKRSGLRKSIFAVLLLVGIAMSVYGTDTDEVKTEVQPLITMIVLDKTINPATAEFVTDSIKKSEELKATLMILQLDTPGGLVDSSRQIEQGILGSKIPIVVYIAPSGARAGSAGTFITMVSHVAAMAPGTRIGAAHPVSGGGKDIEGDMRKKVENDLAAGIEAYAKERGRNAEWAVKAVRESDSISDGVAVEKGVVEISAATLEELIEKLDGREVKLNRDTTLTLKTKGARVQQLQMSMRQKIVSTISEPNVAYIILMVGLLLLFLEYINPGMYIPGIAGAICLVLFFGVQVMPINYLGLLFIMLGIAFFVAEIFIVSFGVLSVIGVASFVLGAILLFDTGTPDEIRVSWSVIIPTVLTITAVMLLLGFLVLKTMIFKKPVSGEEGLVGEEGVAVTDLSPEGKIFFHGEYWNAVSDENISEGEKIVIKKVKNLKAWVEKPGKI